MAILIGCGFFPLYNIMEKKKFEDMRKALEDRGF
jgi:hypothetical protein